MISLNSCNKDVFQPAERRLDQTYDCFSSWG